MIDLLKPDHFRGLSEPLVVLLDSGEAQTTISMTVESVDLMPSHLFREEPFSLILCGPRNPLLDQATYLVRHPTLGTIELFLVPIGRIDAGTRYQAVFN